MNGQNDLNVVTAMLCAFGVPILLIIYAVIKSRISAKKEANIMKAGDEPVVVTYRAKRIRMTMDQKEGWDRLSRAQKNHFLKSEEAKRFKVKR